MIWFNQLDTHCRVEIVRLTSIAVALLPVLMEELVKMSQMASMCALVLLGSLVSTVRSLNAASLLPAAMKEPAL